MSRRRYVLVLTPVILVAACGSSKHAATSSSVHSSESSASTTLSAASTTSAESVPTVTTTSGPASPPRTTGSTATVGASNVRIPATFTIRPGGALNPPSITSPASVPVELTVVSGDGRRHQVLLRTPKPHSLSVPAHGRAGVLIAGLPAGRYVIVIDGVARGALTIGGAPGP